MKLTRLRIVGFKSFVEPTEFLIEPGLTGVIGPNGCGKSNLVEALRWVMGESSYKNMRASGMDDVIFAGSGHRPARNVAEVTLTADNAGRTAPAAFNDADTLEISRRIEREQGSNYRINGREVRARDVQILFADAATGARSAALVRQGQISELIAAKPQARRRILEDAAGIAGLHARRHEAELRLKGAEDNLVRVEDVLGGLDSQVDGLRRQARQAVRYRGLSAEIRKLEAVILLVGYAQARAQAQAADAERTAAAAAVAERTAAQAEAVRAQAIGAHALPGLRQAQAAAAAAVARLTHARAALDAEERRAKERLTELNRAATEIERDLARQRAAGTDAAASLARLQEEAEELAARREDAGPAREEAQERLAALEAALQEGERALDALQAQASDAGARRAALERARRDEAGRVARFASERAGLERQIEALSAEAGEPVEDLRAALDEAEDAALSAEERAAEAREALRVAREAETRSRAPLAEAERIAQRLETEARTLAKLFAPDPTGRHAPAHDAITVARGFETALGAALGDDLEASLDGNAPVHWGKAGESTWDPPLPDGVRPLIDVVEAPPALHRRLAQIGIVPRTEGPRLQGQLQPGQRLVSPEGDLWRWDGLVAAADAPSAAARRLAERNRLGDLREEAEAAREAAELRRADAEAAAASVRTAVARETESLEAARLLRRALDAARERLASAERRAAELGARRSGLDEALARVRASEAEAGEREAAAADALEDLADASDLDARLAELRAGVAGRRTAAAEARAALQGLTREAELAGRRAEAVAGEIRMWTERSARAAGALEELETRLERTRDEIAELAEAPDTLILRRRALLSEIEAAEARARASADALAQAETALGEADRRALGALEAMAAAREALAGAEARLEALTLRANDIARSIADHLDTDPAGLYALTGLRPDAPLPDSGETETRLALLKADRDRMGGVNLRAEEELAEIEGRRDSLSAERDDLVEAIKRLRGAVQSLNREGRERLLAAFQIVNGHFQRLFTTLFGGGTAELTLVDADDPLEAGLEILARPPGKKPQTMTLLSGGEQALTATALIFAVFLTNPSPICVLDEVDAPLDDANVERYCDLLDEMARQTETRFVVITHNPITMARMNRLFGVTMAERGVSQLVSVDLEGAVELREVG
ncbi:chromosome segregation protein SMC [Salinarimonas soli]|uniref:Chromosome partition protein Smc n=1 Tax=Salinarimonas soli TaxID=1638099 RepID=A0A5B2VBZ4_9HYPH|nr:chromosome segregation protein SMC [Salinarimonas soli]KAA2236215.1 chromosome segregation protein SMC [Salinarimonas soli]